MKYKITKDDFEKLSDEAKAEYEKKGDDYVLKLEGIEIEDTTNLKKTLDKVRDELKTAEKTLKSYKDIDPEKYKDLIAQEEAKSKELKEKELELARKTKDIETLEKNLQSAHEAAINDLKSTHKAEIDAAMAKITELETSSGKSIQELTRALETEMIEKRSQAAIAKHGGDLLALEHHVRKDLRLVKDGEKYVTRVVDPKGTEAEPYRKNDKGEYITEEDYVAEMKQADTFAHYFSDERLPPGSGFHRSPDGSRQQTPDNRSGVEQIKAGLEKMRK